jgi:hypothetical protein
MKFLWRTASIALTFCLTTSVVWQPESVLAAQRASGEETPHRVRSEKSGSATRSRSPHKSRNKASQKPSRKNLKFHRAPTSRPTSLGFDGAVHGSSFPKRSDLTIGDDATVSTLRRLFDDNSVCAKVDANDCSPSAPPHKSASLGFDVAIHGFSFPNWSDLGSGDDATVSTLRRLFDDNSVCAKVDANGCLPHETATVFLSRLNTELTKGHCEGIALAAYHYFSSGRQAVSTLTVADVVDDINYFALTQVLPNAAKQTRESRMLDLSLIADRVFENLQRGGGMTIGLHENTRAHTVLPIAIDIDGDTATISVYDSNTPGRPQSMTLDLSTNEWTYTSYSTDGAILDRWSGTRNLSTVDLAARAPVSTSAFRQ